MQMKDGSNYKQIKNEAIIFTESWDSVVGIATGYRLDDQGVGV
jgi:hypothetical protein